MKNFKTKFLGLALAGLILGACSQTGTYENADLMNEQAVANKAGFKLTPFGSSNENARTFPSSTDCSNPLNCLVKGEPITFTKNYNSGELVEGTNKKVVTATVSLIIGTDNMAYYRVDYASQRTGGSSNEDVVINGSLAGQPFSRPVGKWNTTNPVVGTFSTTPFDYTTIKCGDTFNFTFNETSKAAPVSWNENIAQLAYCLDGCEDEFSAILNCTNPAAKTLTVTFTAENAGDYVIQGGLTNGAIIGSAIATADFIRNTSHQSAGGPSSVTRWEGSLDECETVTVTITYSGGAGVGGWSAKSIVDGVEVVNGESEDQDCD